MDKRHVANGKRNRDPVPLQGVPDPIIYFPLDALGGGEILDRKAKIILDRRIAETAQPDFGRGNRQDQRMAMEHLQESFSDFVGRDAIIQANGNLAQESRVRLGIVDEFSRQEIFVGNVRRHCPGWQCAWFSRRWQ